MWVRLRGRGGARPLSAASPRWWGRGPRCGPARSGRAGRGGRAAASRRPSATTARGRPPRRTRRPAQAGFYLLCQGIEWGGVMPAVQTGTTQGEYPPVFHEHQNDKTFVRTGGGRWVGGGGWVLSEKLRLNKNDLSCFRHIDIRHVGHLELALPLAPSGWAASP